jgi:hypothetical protein
MEDELAVRVRCRWGGRARHRERRGWCPVVCVAPTRFHRLFASPFGRRPRRSEGQQRVAARLLASDVTIGTNDARAPTAHTPARTRARERNHERRGRREADYDLGSRGGRRDHGDALVRRGGARLVLPPSIDLVPRASPRLVRVDALSPRLPAERGSTRRRRTRRSSLARSPRGASAR